LLILSRKLNQTILIGDDIAISVVYISKGKGKGKGRVKLGIEAPIEIPVHRSEVQAEIDEQRRWEIDDDDGGDGGEMEGQADGR
jgi:carbon storage regulator